MERIPGLGLVQNAATSSGGSLRDASRPWAALGETGKQLAATGDMLASHVMKQQQIALQRQSAEMELDFSRVRDQYEMEMLSNPNLTPEGAREGWEAISQNFRKRYIRDNMSEAEKNSIMPRAESLLQNGAFEVEKTSTIANIQNAKTANLNLWKYAEEKNDVELRNVAASSLKGLIADDVLLSMVQGSDRTMALASLESNAKENPFQFEALLENKDKFLEQNPEASESDYDRIVSINRTARSTHVTDAWDGFYDGVVPGGSINNEGDIDIEYGVNNGYPPRLAKEMKAKYRDIMKPDEKAKYKDENYVNKKTTELNDILKKIHLMDGDDFATNLGEAKFIVSMLPESGAKNTYKAKLDSINDDRQGLKKTRADYVISAVEMMVKSNALGKVIPEPTSMPVTQAMRAGFLKDQKKMAELGLDEKQIGAVNIAKTDALKVDVFQRYYDPSKVSKKAAEIDIATADAIKRGSADVGYVNPQDYDEWIKSDTLIKERSGSILNAVLDEIDKDPNMPIPSLLIIVNEKVKDFKVKGLIPNIDDEE